MKGPLEDHVLVRPMTGDDVEIAYHAATMAFTETAEERERVLSRTAEEVANRQERYRHFLHTDPEGCWVAADGEQVVGVAIAFRREKLWGLSMFVVAAGYRGKGVGTSLLERALSYYEGCRGGIIASSTHPAAMRRYATAGFALHPTLTAKGSANREMLPAGLAVRDGEEADLELAADVDRYLRGAAHGPDLEFILRTGARFLVSEHPAGRGYATVWDCSPWLVAATHAAVAMDLLWACLADAPAPGMEVEVRWLTGAQQWAVRVALAAGLELESAGPLCFRGELGSLAPYLPNGGFL